MVSKTDLPQHFGAKSNAALFRVPNFCVPSAPPTEKALALKQPSLGAAAQFGTAANHQRLELMSAHTSLVSVRPPDPAIMLGKIMGRTNTG